MLLCGVGLLTLLLVVVASLTVLVDSFNSVRSELNVVKQELKDIHDTRVVELFAAEECRLADLKKVTLDCETTVKNLLDAFETRRRDIIFACDEGTDA